jgi:hypothetical protein
VRVDVKAEVTTIGEVRATFSIAHREPDSNSRNDSAVVVTRGVMPDVGKGG